MLAKILHEWRSQIEKKSETYAIFASESAFRWRSPRLSRRGRIIGRGTAAGWARKYWTRRGIAEWLADRLADDAPTLVGIDHRFPFPLRYSKRAASSTTGLSSSTISSAIGQPTTSRGSSAGGSGRTVHFCPLDGWDIPAGRSVIDCGAADALEGRTTDQHDAFCIAAWLGRAERDGMHKGLAQARPFAAERAVAPVERWVLGVPGLGRASQQIALH
jgi:hypothetical protein